MDGDSDTAVDVLDVSDVNLQVDSGYTALHWACMYGHVDIVRILLSKFASTDITDDNRRTPAMCG
jgi:ankyrin repeat protein